MNYLYQITSISSMNNLKKYDFKVSRPSIPSNYINGNTDIVFQLLECTQSTRPFLPGLSKINASVVPEIKLYGITISGLSVCARILNHEPYLWIKAPYNWNVSLTENFKSHINILIANLTQIPDTINRIETYDRKSLMNYSSSNCSFLKIFTSSPYHISKVRKFFIEGFEFSLLWDKYKSFETYESNVPYTLRYLVDNSIGGSNWIVIKRKQYIIMEEPITLSQIEIVCSEENVISHEAVGEWMKIAPFRILSIDIECIGRKGQFPEAQHDPVIQIACQGRIYGNENFIEKSIFLLNTCAPIASANVYSYQSEIEMLIAFSHFLIQYDPDFITGYNIINFDLPYLIDRSKALKIENEFCIWSRLLGQLTVARDKKLMSKQMGNREYKEIVAEGRVFLDVMIAIQRNYNLRSYSLNSVSAHFLGEQKEDVHHSIISDLQMGTDENRRRLAIYCLKDAYLPLRLIDKLMIIVNNVEMSRVTGIPIGWILERGQQIKIFSQILRKAKAKNLVFPTIEYTAGSITNEKGFEGATVIEPIKGYYKSPIATLDFASLYPSIMMAHNLCYSTLVLPHDVHKYDTEDLTITPSKHTFVKKSVYPGILPDILLELLNARKNAKKMMKEAKDDLEYAVLNGRQLALKISANSVYGFTGAQLGKLPCLEISASVTSFGRLMIEHTKFMIEKLYSQTKVIYGDTDSVMVKVNTNADDTDESQLNVAMSFGKEAAERITKEFIPPIKLEFEKVYFPYLLMNKKRYAGLHWTNSKSWDKLDAKGIETVRRDNAPIVANVISGVLNRILIQRSLESAIEYVKGTISDLLLNRLDISQLVITKTYSKSGELYQNKQAHIVLAERMRYRDPGSAPSIGDRIAYVIVKGSKGTPTFDKSEDPIYVLENNIPIDTQYYLEHQLAGPIERIFEGVLSDPRSLLSGEHTRHIILTTPSTQTKGSIGKFFKVDLQCLGCKTKIKSGAVCSACSDITPDIYSNILNKRNHYESVFSSVWTQCQQCQELLGQEVICTSRDCPVFYIRKKVQRDLKEQQSMLDRFN